MSKTALLFLFLFSAGLFLAFLKHPIYGVFSYMLVFYMAPENAWWAENIPDLRWSLLAAAVTMIAAVRLPNTPFRPPWYKLTSIRLLIAFAIWLWIQSFWAISLDNHIFLASLFSKYVLLYAILYTSLSNPKIVRQFFYAHIIGCFYWGVMAYLNPGSGRLENLGSGDVAGSAFASMHMGTGLAFAGFAFLGNSGVLRWLAFSSIPFVLNAIVLMATRGALVGLLFGAPAAILFSGKSQRRIIIACVALGGILLLILAHEIFWERMSTIPLTEKKTMEASAASRIDIAIANYKMFLDYPFGVGHRGNELLSPLYMPDNLLTQKDGSRVRSAHNTLMAILVDHSLIGLILMVLFHGAIVRSLFGLIFRRAGQRDPSVLVAYAAALGTSLVIYWGNAQFANCTKSEVVIWIAALSSALKWMDFSPSSPKFWLSRKMETWGMK